jgi:hypothetical protein
MIFQENEKYILKQLKRTLYANMNVLFRGLSKSLEEHLRENAILTGGAISSLMHWEIPKDYDLYFKDSFSLASFNQYITTLEDKDIIKDVDEKYIETLVDGKCITANAVTFKNNVQVIKIGTGDMRERFDFVHCMPWYDIAKNKLHISRRQYDSIRNRKLVKNTHAEANSLCDKRIEKYVKRGWRF